MRAITHWVLTTFASPIGILILGDKVGDAGLERFAPARYLASARRRIKKTTRSGALAALSLIPPPFPFTPIVLAAGALKVKAAAFFTALVACRFVRFGLESYLARRYGPQTLDWLESPIVENAVLAFLALGVVLTTITLVRVVRSSGSSRRRAPA